MNSKFIGCVVLCALFLCGTFLERVEAVEYTGSTGKVFDCSGTPSQQSNTGENFDSSGNICDGSDGTYAISHGSIGSGETSKIVTVTGFGITYDWPEYIPTGYIVQTVQTTDNNGDYLKPLSIVLAKPDGTFSSDRTSTASLNRFDDSYGNRIDYGGLTDTWGTSLTQASTTNSNFGVKFQYAYYSGGSSKCKLFNVWMNVGYKLVTNINSVYPNSYTGNFNAWTTPTVTVVGATFRNITGNVIKCMFGNVQTSGVITNATAISCPLPAQATYGTYYVYISLGQSLWTDNVVAFNYICDANVVCSGHGTCNPTGTCTCNIGWGGSSCSTPNCVNGKTDAGEACDDGNAVNTDGCSNTCVINSGWACQNFANAPSVCRKCGDAILQQYESCDDGNFVNGDGCSSNCTVETATGWVCQGTLGSRSYCNRCPDGVIQTPNENCDDNNTVVGDGCSFCIRDVGFTCVGSPSQCYSCGNSIRETLEQCDDGNLISGDGCNSTCGIERGYVCSGSKCSTVCGDGIVVSGKEVCDDGNLKNGDGCSSNCTLELGWNCTVSFVVPTSCASVCGDLYIVGNETCEDGNTVPTDGCANCTIQKGFSCVQTAPGTPSVCNAGCGNDVKTINEECDDGNTLNGDGCSALCKIESGWGCNLTANSNSSCFEICGNGIITISETCDDGNTLTGDGCNSGCTVENGWICDSATPSRCKRCGDGIIQYGEECDDFNTRNSDGCSSTCLVEAGYVCFANGTGVSICSICGDGLVQGYEVCDDGNHVNGDGCSSSCLVETGFSCSGTNPTVCNEICGDGLIVGTEACDDANFILNDGCVACSVMQGWICIGQPSLCFEKCGNYFMTKSEQCDDGNVAPGDGCSAICRVEVGWNCTGTTSTCVTVCGDGLIKSSEQCDDHNLVDGDGCTSGCQIEPGWSCSSSPSRCSAICGDGIITGAEVCDDGNFDSGDGCAGDCLSIEFGYACENGTLPSVCSVVCGDGFIVGSETCDDGNTVSFDGCSSKCLEENGWYCSGLPSDCVTFCGDTLIAGEESCDDGNPLSNDGCGSDCVVEYGWICSGSPSNCTAICGNGFLSGSETCDDGNFVSGDGCAPDCKKEVGWTCVGQPSNCQPHCGDSLLRGNEQCDDGNTKAGDGCNSTCLIEPGFTCTGIPSVCITVCGNNVTTSDELCDQSATVVFDISGCYSNCTVMPGWVCNTINLASNCYQYCGDGIVTSNEACDDGNAVANDGCFNCAIESGFVCDSASPSICTAIEQPLGIAESKSLTPVIGGVVGGLLGALLMIIIAGLIYRRKVNEWKKLEKPDFATIAYADGVKAFINSESIPDRKVLKTLETLLLEDDGWLATALCSVTAVTELEKLCKALVYIFHKHNRCLQLVKSATLQEIRNSDTDNTLFRGNSYACKMFTVYSRLIGLEYLWKTLGLIVYEINQMGVNGISLTERRLNRQTSLHHTSVELDPNKLDEGGDITANRIQIQLFVHKMWKTVVDNESLIPTEFRELFLLIKTEVSKKFTSDNSAIYKGIGAFFFLRYVCPSLASPHVYGLLNEPLNEKSQRYAILLSKVLQNISNGTLPGTKEEYMKFLTGFIQDHIQQARDFFDVVSNEHKDKVELEYYPVPDNLDTYSLHWIQKHMKTIAKRLDEVCAGQSEEFRKAIEQICQTE